jgi:hypothetical protein
MYDDVACIFGNGVVLCLYMVSALSLLVLNACTLRHVGAATWHVLQPVRCARRPISGCTQGVTRQLLALVMNLNVSLRGLLVGLETEPGVRELGRAKDVRCVGQQLVDLVCDQLNNGGQWHRGAGAQSCLIPGAAGR